MRIRMLVLTIVMLVASVGCNEERMTAWVMTGQDTDLNIRAGAESKNADMGSTEIFFTAKYLRSSDIPWGPEPTDVGVGIIFYPTVTATIQDTPQPSPLQGLLESLNAQPYAGIEFIGPLSGHQRKVQPNWIVGTMFTLAPESDFAIAVEYTDGDQAAGDVYIGGRGKFFQF